VRLDEDAGVLLVHVAHFLARRHSLGEAFIEGEGGDDSLAVGADAAGIRETVGRNRGEAVGGLGEQDGEGVFARAT
jgi:hypothetical protein